MHPEIFIATLTSPVVLFFVLGLAAALARSDMSIPESFAKGIALYLMIAIGLKGGVEMSKSGLDFQVIAVMIAAIGLSFGLPLLAFQYLKRLTRLDRVNAAAVAAHYGSISIVTFVAATEAVRLTGLSQSGYLVAVAAIMESPAIISALYLAGSAARPQNSIAGSQPGELFREVALNASVVTLLGSLIIGWVSGVDGFARVEPFFVTPFQGVLCVFLLDMGLAAGRGLRRGWRDLDRGTLAFGVLMPLSSAVITSVVALILRLPAGDAALLITLAASASYIAVPAAMRLALPQAQPSIYLTLSLGITFPFNLTLGIPLYLFLGNLIGT